MPADLGHVAAQHPDLSIGSYPSIVDGRFHNEVVVRGKDPAQIAAAVTAIEQIIADLRATGRDKYTIT